MEKQEPTTVSCDSSVTPAAGLTSCRTAGVQGKHTKRKRRGGESHTERNPQDVFLVPLLLLVLGLGWDCFNTAEESCRDVLLHMGEVVVLCA